jgi:hypothetical protein
LEESFPTCGIKYLTINASGCVVWIYFDEKSFDLGPFLFFGFPAGEPLLDILGFKVAKHTKANSNGMKAERPAIRVVNKRKFNYYKTVHDLYDVLFVRA